MATNPVCCGCHLVDDYGTSTVQGTGTLAEPFSVNMVDPTFIRPMARISRSTDTALVAGTPTTVQFDTEIFDSASLWDIGLPSRIVFPVSGIYLIGLQTEVRSGGSLGGSTERSLVLSLNGAEVYKKNLQPVSIGELTIELVYTVVVSVGDYVEMVGESSQASDFFVGSATVASSQVAWATYLGKVV